MKITKMMRITVEEKKAKGTHQACRDDIRPLPEIREEIQDALDTIQAMRDNLKMAVQGIKDKGMYLFSPTTNNHGETVTQEKLNPAFKVQREALSAINGLKRALVLLREEEAQALKLEKPEKNEFEGLD